MNYYIDNLENNKWADLPISKEEEIIYLLFLDFEKDPNSDGLFLRSNPPSSLLGERVKKLLSLEPKTVKKLEKDRFIRVNNNPDDALRNSMEGKYYQISDLGKEKVLNWPEEKKNWFKYKFSREAAIPASDRTVPLDHNSQAYGEATNALERVHETIRSKNDLGISSEEKKTCLVMTEIMQTILNLKAVIESFFQEFIVPKLWWIAEKCADKAIDALIGAAITAVLALSTL